MIYLVMKSELSHPDRDSVVGMFTREDTAHVAVEYLRDMDSKSGFYVRTFVELPRIVIDYPVQDKSSE